MLDYRDLETSDGFSSRLVVGDDGKQYVFVSDDALDDLWLCTCTVPAGINFQGMHVPPGDEPATSKLCALLGMEWLHFEDDFDHFVGWQRMCQRNLGPNMLAQLERASTEEIRELAQSLRQRTSGEFLRAHLTGDDVRAVSN